jgi:hypothetical protein
VFALAIQDFGLACSLLESLKSNKESLEKNGFVRTALLKREDRDPGMGRATRSSHSRI